MASSDREMAEAVLKAAAVKVFLSVNADTKIKRLSRALTWLYRTRTTTIGKDITMECAFIKHTNTLRVISPDMKLSEILANGAKKTAMDELHQSGWEDEEIRLLLSL